MKTTDGGLSWAGVFGDFLYFNFGCMFSALIVDPSSPGIVYAVWEQGLLKTSNGGAIWEPLNSGFPDGTTFYSLAIDPVQTAVLYATTNLGAFKSVDGGASWTPMTTAGLPVPRVSSLTVSRSNHNIVYAAAGGVVYSIEQEETCLFCDDFQDGDASNWQLQGNWSAIGGALVGSGRRKITALAPSTFSGCGICRVSALMETAGNIFPDSTAKVSLIGWYQDERNYVELIMKQGAHGWVLRQLRDGVVAVKKRLAGSIEAGVMYRAEIVFNGSAFSVFINDRLAGSVGAAAGVSGTVGFRVKAGIGSFEEISVY